MPFEPSILRDQVSDYLEPIIATWEQRSRILIVIDGDLSISADDSFGISKAVANLRAFTCGFGSFSVTLATRDGERRTNQDAGPEEFHYEGFRFDQPLVGGRGPAVLDGYDQVWLFGFQPKNGPENDPNDQSEEGDDVVNNPSFHPLSVAELRALSLWMDAGGGVFAAGDHHRLGASMCHKIPRVRTMRRWLVRDEVPTRDNETRYDTLQRVGRYISDDEEDSKPQPIRWVPSFDMSVGLFQQRAPHPILCHPQHGPIDVLPDHMHEGRCYDPSDPEWFATHADATDEFDGFGTLHYPTVNGKRPFPRAIAFGQTQYQPGETPLIVVYDGQQIGRGRVVVDSTWHHWFDMNLAGLDRPPPDRDDYEKITRYHINVAIWLASPSWRSAAVLSEIKLAQFGYFGREQYSPKMDSANLGAIALEQFARRVGPCWLWQLNEDLLAGIEIERAMPRPGPRPCLACPPPDYIHAVMLGELVKAVYADMPEVQRQIANQGRLSAAKGFEKDPHRLATEAARRGAAEVAKAWREDLVNSEVRLKQFEAAGKTTT